MLRVDGFLKDIRYAMRYIGGRASTGSIVLPSANWCSMAYLCSWAYSFHHSAFLHTTIFVTRHTRGALTEQQMYQKHRHRMSGIVPIRMQASSAHISQIIDVHLNP